MSSAQPLAVGLQVEAFRLHNCGLGTTRIRASSRAKRQRRAKPQPVRVPKVPPRVSELSERAWRISASAILSVAAFLRLYELGMRPMHHDESVNGNFMVDLVRHGVYKYDPANYHGPTLYYLALLLTKAHYYLAVLIARLHGSVAHTDGLGEVTFRLVPMFFGLGTVWLMLCLRKAIGTRAALAAAALCAVSPGTVFYSRYFIHETQFIFFTLGMVVSIWLAHETRDPMYLLVAAGAAALMVATKETWVIYVSIIAGSVLARRMFAAYRGRPLRPWREALERLGGWRRLLIYTGTSTIVFAIAFVLFYSSFFHNPQGIHDAFEAYKPWTRTGVNQTLHDWTSFGKWVWGQEWPLLLVGLAGIAVTAAYAPGSFAMFAGIWSLGVFAAHSLIPYKTPWLILNSTVPMMIVGGYGAAVVWERARGESLHFVRALGIVLLGILLWQTIQLNFVNYDDNDQPYIYVHTTRQILPLLHEIESVARRTGAGTRLHITIDAPEYWPLPWYLRDYPNAGYWAHIIDSDEPIIIGQQQQDEELTAKLTGKYKRFGDYFIRPGVTMTLWVRNDVAYQ